MLGWLEASGTDDGQSHLNKDRHRDTTVRSILGLVDKATVEGRQERIVENIIRGGPFLEFEILGHLVDRAIEADRIDAADAVLLYLAGQDVVGDHNAQPRQFQFTRSAIHPGDHYLVRPRGILDGPMP